MTIHSDDHIILDEAALMQLIARGDHNAFKELFDQLSSVIFKTCFAILLDHQAAEDAMQESFVRLWNHAGEWSADAKIKTWLNVVARNYCYDVLRKAKSDLKKNEEFYKDQLNQDTSQTCINESYFDHSFYDKIMKNAVFSLPQRQREALSLVYYSELHNYEAADIMELNVGAFDSLLARARRNLNANLETHKDALRGHFFDEK